MLMNISRPTKQQAVFTTTFWQRVFRRMKNDWQLYVLLLPTIAFFFIFFYRPMYGIQIVFRDFKLTRGITGSKWVGLRNFTDYFTTYYAGRQFANTFLLNIYGLLWGFPMPIIFAILLNQLHKPRLKKFTQTAIYVPHFISTTVMAGMLYLFFSPSNGIVNRVIQNVFGGESIYFMILPEWFRPLYIGSDIWQHTGWNTILYIATLTAIDPSLYEAAEIDGAGKWKKILHIDLPSLLPIATMMFILNCGSLLGSNTDKALLMQTSGNLPTSDIIGVYVYKHGLESGKYSFAAAIGLSVNILNFAMIITVNAISKRISETSLF